ncbi:MAG: DUF2238 domain-containing protein [Solirubrobacteraceae bacterium]|nr:DUF2238 domain-containing protein [Solirubrobacteraceae bacterium]
MTLDTRRLVMGDWSRVVRDPLDVLRLVFAAGAVAFAVSGDAAAAFNLGLAFAVLVAARLANLPRLYDLATIVALMFTQGGEALGLYDTIEWYDRVVHFVVPLLASQIIYLCLARIEVMPDPSQETLPRHEAGMLIAVFALGLAVGALWEIFEWSSDGIFGSELSEGNTDTVGDLIADAGGSLAGGALMVLWSERGWGSVRRIPGENRREDTRS